MVFADPPGQKSFDSLDDAVNALVGAFRSGDRKALVQVLGPKGVPVVSSGDIVADREAYQRFVAAYDRAHRLEGGGGKVVLYVGDDDFPVPIPLVPDGPRWFWDTDAGDDEILFRRIGRNELSAIQVCLAYVDAQREYATMRAMGIPRWRLKMAVLGQSFWVGLLGVLCAVPFTLLLAEGANHFAVAATNTAWSGPWGVSYTANLTPDVDTGLGAWTVRDFKATIRTGRHMGRCLFRAPLRPAEPTTTSSRGT